MSIEEELDQRFTKQVAAFSFKREKQAELRGQIKRRRDYGLAKRHETKEEHLNDRNR